MESDRQTYRDITADKQADSGAGGRVVDSRCEGRTVGRTGRQTDGRTSSVPRAQPSYTHVTLAGNALKQIDGVLCLAVLSPGLPRCPGLILRAGCLPVTARVDTPRDRDLPAATVPPAL